MTTTKQALLERQKEAQAQEAELYGGVVEEPVPEDGTWRVKDHVAHLAAWRRRAVEVINRAGARVDNVDDWNAKAYERTRDLPPEEIVREARDSWSELIGAVETLSDEQLHEPHPYNPDLELWVVVFANGDKHFEEHAGYIAELQKA